VSLAGAAVAEFWRLGLPGPLAMSVAARARSVTADHGGGTGLGRARVRTRAGRWLVARGSVLGDGPESRVASLLGPARPPELAPLIADAYGFTERERMITALLRPLRAPADRTGAALPGEQRLGRPGPATAGGTRW